MPAPKSPESREKTDKSGRAGIPTRPDFFMVARRGRPFGPVRRCSFAFWHPEIAGFSGFSTAHMEKAPISCAFLTSTPFILREMP
jgi:hypothetical protein